MKKLSIIVPCYNEEEVLPLFYAEITRVMDEMKRTYAELTFELLFIDDGSRDKTLTQLRELATKDQRRLGLEGQWCESLLVDRCVPLRPIKR